MNTPVLAVRELQESDIEAIVNYWLTADAAYLEGMGVELSKIPGRSAWIHMLKTQVHTPLKEKQSYCLIWTLNGKAVGHSNTNKIIFGQEAYMHLHIWEADIRRQGLGSSFLKLTIPHFFQNLQLKTLFCEPYALNPAPNKTLQKVGFQLLQEYTTTPGWINFEQPVKLWQMSLERFRQVEQLWALENQPSVSAR
ncbi:GNAT family N-acetyltransferase [Sabulibacter ruber]|uniref:GNAT family N-acetyltransferase n=1 Tax=Sabulibacter ruber TaxID=2811901 RepID=UPI001A970C0C|nr:GNAT family protein [Sabulibacter ruber]